MVQNNKAVNKIHCVACKEDISPDASICPRCGSSQRFFRFKALGLIVSWLGGIVTVITFIIGIITLNQYYQQAIEKQQSITQHIEAAQWLIKTGNYQQAWQIYDQANQISNSSQQISQARLSLALLWIKNFQIEKNKLSATLDAISLALYQGLSSTNKIKKADILAHIGYLQAIRKLNRLPIMVDVESLFKMAFNLDKKNVYANAMHARWILLERPITVAIIKQASKQFNLAQQTLTNKNQDKDKTKDKRQFIRRVQLISLLNYSYAYNDDIKIEALTSLINIVIEMITNNENPPTPRTCDDIMSSYDRQGNAQHLEALIKRLPNNKHLLAYQWLQQSSKETRPKMLIQSTYVIARLNEALNNKQTALNEYQSLLSSPNISKKLSPLISAGINRLRN